MIRFFNNVLGKTKYAKKTEKKQTTLEITK